MITRIYADNYKCFTNFTFEPKRMNLLVGDNGTGKTSLLTLLTSLRSLATRSDALRHAFTHSATRWDTRGQQRFEVTFSKADASYDWTILLSTDAESGRTIIERETIAKAGTVIASLEGGAKKLMVRGASVPIPYELEASLLALRLGDPDLRQIHDLIVDMLVVKLDVPDIGAVSEKADFGLAVDGKNFASHYRHMRFQDFERTQRLHENLRTVIGGFRNLDFADIGGESKLLVAKLFAKEGQPDYPIPFNQLSDGQRALVVLYHLITTFDLRGGRLVFVDEPDNFVSLRELQPWLQSLSLAIEDDGAQAIIVSHSPEVIDFLAADNAWVFERDDGGPARVRPLPVDRGSGIKASQQIARGWLRET